MTSLAFVSNLFGTDSLLIFMVLLLLFGAKKLPELAKGLGSAVREFSKAKDEIEHEITRPPQQRIEQPKETEVAKGTVEVHPAEEVQEVQDKTHAA